MATRIIRDDADLQQWLAFLQGQPLPMTVSHAKGAKRSLQQNATAHMWYAQIGAELGESADEAKARCKLVFGLPIMERDNPAWVSEWRPLYEPLDYDRRLTLFKALPLTSKFTTSQMAEYMDAVQRDHLAMGIPLVDPEARKYEGEVA